MDQQSFVRQEPVIENCSWEVTVVEIYGINTRIYKLSTSYLKDDVDTTEAGYKLKVKFFTVSNMDRQVSRASRIKAGKSNLS